MFPRSLSDWTRKSESIVESNFLALTPYLTSTLIAFFPTS